MNEEAEDYRVIFNLNFVSNIDRFDHTHTHNVIVVVCYMMLDKISFKLNMNEVFNHHPSINTVTSFNLTIYIFKVMNKGPFVVIMSTFL